MGKLISALFLLAGSFILIQVILPVLSFKILELKILKSNTILVSPLNNKQVLGVSVENNKEFPAFYSVVSRENLAPFKKFDLSIPSLNLNKIPVQVDSNDLSLALAHLPGTALPGEKGNIFISGHSAIPIASKGINAFFEKLTDLKKGESVFITAGNVQYSYKIIDLKIVNPKDTSVILPPDSQGRYITLMTCVPPGLNTKRLVVIGKLI